MGAEGGEVEAAVGGEGGDGEEQQAVEAAAQAVGRVGHGGLLSGRREGRCCGTTAALYIILIAVHIHERRIKILACEEG
ncbi:hypothetical protein GCM10009759_49540 [Kitasatospora saccharophila]|uniref:Uncharacterized protein n=1 Tax=Kitasatospora saccharophila TaxID=407973 RepID=A0ABN2XBN8_9ACTN